MILHEPFFGNWYLERKLGSGSFGTVYSIYREENDGKRIHAAMKVIQVPNAGADIDDLRAQGYSNKKIKAMYKPQLDKLKTEIDVLNQFRGDDHIVIYEESKIVDLIDSPGWEIYIRMEELQNLDKYLEQKRASTEDLLNLWIDIAKALRLVHKRGVIHRDIKPENILVSREGMYKLADFGIARHLEQGSTIMTKAGSYPYMAPEVNAHQAYDHRSDIYSLGIVMYRMFNHKRYPFLPDFPQPFYPKDRDEALAKRFEGEKIPKPKGLEEKIWKILEKSIEYNKEDRFANADELLDALTHLSIEQQQLYRPINLESNTPKSGTWKWILLIVLTTVFAMFILFLLWAATK